MDFAQGCPRQSFHLDEGARHLERSQCSPASGFQPEPVYFSARHYIGDRNLTLEPVRRPHDSCLCHAVLFLPELFDFTRVNIEPA